MLDSLARRPRSRWLYKLTSGQRSKLPGQRGAAAQAQLERVAPLNKINHFPVSDELFSRLSVDDIAAIEASLAPQRRELCEGFRRDGDDGLFKHHMIAFAVHEGPDQVVERLGLSRAVPPEDVHALGRGPLAAGGDYHSADIIAASLSDAGAPLGGVQRGLDFGCSSGRVVRVLASAFPQMQWHGCDPIPGAIDWAQGNLAGISFELSPLRPPLEHPDASFDVAFAWSVWSHFGAGPGTEWLAEVHRVIRPGGHLLITTHGPTALCEWYRRRAWNTDDLLAIRDELTSSGFAFREVFGAEGDGGVAQEGWGNAFMTLGWLAERACPAWSIQLYAQGRIYENQDLIVLRREAQPAV